MPKKKTHTQQDRTIREDVPYTMRLPDGRTLFILVPAKWCERDVSGEALFKPEAVRFLDRVLVMAMHMPAKPTPGFIRTLRDALGLTQAGLAQRIGVDKMTVARWEWGKVEPSGKAVKALKKLRRAVGRKGVTVAA